MLEADLQGLVGTEDTAAAGDQVLVVGVVLDLRGDARTACAAAVHRREARRLAGELRHVVVVVVGDPEIDHPDQEQCEHRKDQGELDDRLAALATKASGSPGAEATLHEVASEDGIFVGHRSSYRPDPPFSK